MSFRLEAPRSVAEALRLLRPSGSSRVAVLAGGTDLLNDIRDARSNPDVVVSLRRLPWSTLVWRNGRLNVGSTVPLRELETDPKVRSRIPGLWQSVRAVGSVALRYQATLGGNLGRASPASDVIPILLALDATVHLTGSKGDRDLPVSEFIRGSRETALGPAELIRAVSMAPGSASEYVWQRVRPANDISQVGVAVARGPEAPYWRIALGGGSPTPVRLPSAEHLLPGPAVSELEVELAAQEAARQAPFLTDKRATEAYRRRVVATLTRRALRSAMDQLRRPTPARRA